MCCHMSHRYVTRHHRGASGIRSSKLLLDQNTRLLLSEYSGHYGNPADECSAVGYVGGKQRQNETLGLSSTCWSGPAGVQVWC